MMKCKKVKKRLLIFIDGDLSEKHRIKIQNHLNGCPDCLKQLNVLSKIWDVTGELEKIEPSPYLWNKLSLRIVEYENNQNIFSAFFETIVRYAVPATAVITLFIGIFAGILLGSIPNSQKLETSSLKSEVSAREKFVKSFYLDSFDDLPQESIGGIYITIASEKE